MTTLQAKVANSLGAPSTVSIVFTYKRQAVMHGYNISNHLLISMMSVAPSGAPEGEGVNANWVIQQRIYSLVTRSSLMEAIVFVNVLLAANEIVENAVKTTQGVLAAYPTTGIYDLILKVKAADEEGLEQVIKKIQSIRGVAGTLTSIVRRKSVR